MDDLQQASSSGPGTATLMSPRALVDRSFDFYAKNWKKIITFATVALAAIYLSDLLVRAYTYSTGGYYLPSWIRVLIVGKPLVLLLVLFFLNFGYLYLVMRSEFDAATVQVRDLSAALIWDYLVAGIFVSIVILGAVWPFMLVKLNFFGGLAGSVVSIYLFFVPLVVFLNEASVKSAMMESWRLVSGKWWSVFWRMLFFAVPVAVIGLVLCLLLGIRNFELEFLYHSLSIPVFVMLIFCQFFALPLQVFYQATLFNDLKTLKDSVGHHIAVKRTFEVLVTILMISGIAGFFVTVFSRVSGF